MKQLQYFLMIFGTLWVCTCCAVTIYSTKNKDNTTATGAGAVATTATKNDAPVASAPAATATEVEKPKSTTAIGPAAAAADYRKAGQDGGALATAPGANASAVTTPPRPTWLSTGLAVVLVVCGGWALLKYFGKVATGGPIYWLLHLVWRIRVSHGK